MLEILEVRCCGLVNPLGVGEETLHFSWKLSSRQGNTVQQSCRVQILDAQEKTVVWDSGFTESLEQDMTACGTKELASNKKYICRVEVTDNHGNRAAKEDAYFTTALKQEEWQGKWIGCQSSDLDQNIRMASKEEMVQAFLNMVSGNEAGVYADRQLDTCNLYRKDFVLEGKPEQAYLSITAHGVYEAYLNGKPVTDTKLNPGFTAYGKYLEFQTFDITSLLEDGQNVFTAVLADGWYKGKYGILGYGNNYGVELSLLAQMEMQYQDGTKRMIATDSSFKYRKTGYLYSDLLIGEKQDGRVSLEQMNCPVYEEPYRAGEWQYAEEKDYGMGDLNGICCEPVRCTEVRKPLEILTTPKGETVVDMGQNMVGYLRLSVEGERGTQLELEYSEVLDKEGNFTNNITGINRDQTDFYILGGHGEEVFEPHFTFHGFRYVKITGYPGKLTLDKVSGIVLGTDLEKTGDFRCSDPLLNQLQSNIRWSQRGNMLSIPTDCPQRERAGWTGDILIYAKTAAFNQNVLQFLKKWLRNMEKEQFEDGLIPIVVPYPLAYSAMQKEAFGSETSAGWGDAAVVVPWVLYEAYGDRSILEEFFGMMKKWMDYVEKEAAVLKEDLPEDISPQRRERQKYLWNAQFHYGDWCYPSCKNEKGETDMFRSAYTTKEYVATAMYANSADVMGKVCETLGKPELAEHYRDLNGKIRKAFADEYIREDGSIEGAVQGIYILALAMKMGDEKQLARMAERLTEMIEANGCRLDTGFLSIQYLLDVLCSYGKTELAGKLLYQDQCPSWLYEVKNGATTIWETWNAILEDGTRTDNSYNHYALGCVGDWMYRNLLGIRSLERGYRKVELSPRFAYGLTYAEGYHDSIYGPIICKWELKDGTGKLYAEVPVGVQAVVRLPGVEETVGSGTYEYTFSEGAGKP